MMKFAVRKFENFEPQDSSDNETNLSYSFQLRSSSSTTKNTF